LLDSEKAITAIAVTALTLSVAYAFQQKNVQMTAIPPNYTPVLPKGTKVSSFVNSRSQKIHTIQLDPSVDNNGEQQPTATVFFLHGICDHSGRSGYCEFYERLAAQNCRVFAMDHHGHGQSEGSPRCYCERFEDYVLDYQEFVEANWKDGDPPIFLAGHSLGGLMAIFLCVQLGDRVNGMILSAPACGVELDFNKKAQLFLSPVLDCLCPQAKIVDAIRSEYLTRNQEERTAYVADPLVCKGKIRLRTGIQISNAFAKLHEEVQSKVKCPLLMVHGTSDKLTEIGSSEAFFHSTATPPSAKLFVRLSGVFHEIFHEKRAEREPVVEFITNFITSGATQFPEGTIDDKRVMVLESTN